MTGDLLITSASIDDPYKDVILSFLKREFPAGLAGKNDILEAITFALIATSHVRFGPSPTPENLVAIRKVISAAQEELSPIRILMPWGSKKPDNGTVDVAEIGALKSLEALQRRVKAVYPPGITINLRVEDTAGQYMWKDESSEALEGSRHYIKEFLTLVDVLGFRSFVNPMLESVLMDGARFEEEAESFKPIFLNYLIDTDAYGIDANVQSRRALDTLGWKGGVSKEQRDFYRSRYARTYPSMSDREKTEKLAGYFAGVMTRIVMQGYGSEAWGSNFLHLTFSPPVPGTPSGLPDRRLYYRTLPDTMARTHIPPWRARGFLKIEGRDVKMKLDNFDPELHLTDCHVTFERDDRSVMVRTPHQVVS